MDTNSICKRDRNTSLDRTFIIDVKDGFKKGMPIMLGYIPVSFTFGLMAVQGGIPVWIALVISMTNLTSAGQFAGVNLIIGGGSLFELCVSMFVINIRYMLMSLSLSQKIMPLSLIKRAAIAFGITDEIFAVASLEKRQITFGYMMGLIGGPYCGWALGTLLGGLTTSILPPVLQDSMGIALYAMFIALIIPAAKYSKAALIVILVAVGISSLFTYTPVLKEISIGWVVILAAVVASALGALLFPREDEET